MSTIAANAAPKCTPAAGGTSYCKDDTCGETICPTASVTATAIRTNGCEVDLRIDGKNCNTCGTCVWPQRTATCNNRVYQIATCDKGYANCSGGYADAARPTPIPTPGPAVGCGKPCTIDNGTPKCDLAPAGQ